MTNLVRMVYVSTTTSPVDAARGGIPKDVGRVLMQSRKNNPLREIGGVLYFNNNYYFQCLEGEQRAVDELYKKIQRDPRHARVKTLYAKRVDQRMFEDWSMKYVALDFQINRVLEKHGLQAFDPYSFDENIIEQILKMFVSAKDKTERKNPRQARPKARVATGFLSRLFSLRKTA